MSRRSSVRGRARAIAAAALVASSSSTLTAMAEPAKPAAAATDSAMVEARARFEEGIKLAEAADHEGARLKFNQAWSLLKSPAILYNLARAEQLSGHPVEALEHYRQFARLPPDPKITDVQRQRAAESITELARKVGQIEVDAPAGARITVDGRAIEPGNTDPIPVAPGTHVVEAIADGKTKRVTVECSAGTITKARPFRKEPVATPEPSNEPAPRNEPAGDAGGPEPSTDAETKRFWTGGRIAGLAVFGGGLAALGAGAVFHSLASASEDEATQIRSALPEPRASACKDPANGVQCAQLKASVDAQSSREDLRTGFFVAGGALAVGGAVLFLLSSPKGEAREGARVVPFATAHDAGVAVLGRF